jgi:hypothetical protein
LELRRYLSSLLVLAFYLPTDCWLESPETDALSSSIGWLDFPLLDFFPLEMGPDSRRFLEKRTKLEFTVSCLIIVKSELKQLVARRALPARDPPIWAGVTLQTPAVRPTNLTSAETPEHSHA